MELACHWMVESSEELFDSVTSTACLSLAVNRFVAVEFPVHHNMNVFLLVRDRLIFRPQIDDAEPRVTKRDSLVG